MKKLRLKLDGIKGMLTREEMKKISGGYEVETSCSATVSCSGGTSEVSCSISGEGAFCSGTDDIAAYCSSGTANNFVYC